MTLRLKVPKIAPKDEWAAQDRMVKWLIDAQVPWPEGFDAMVSASGALIFVKQRPARES